MIYYDPPSGWKFGFPKPYLPANPNEPLRVTLARDGYPEEYMEIAQNHTRFWDSTPPAKEDPTYGRHTLQQLLDLKKKHKTLIDFPLLTPYGEAMEDAISDILETVAKYEDLSS